MSKHMHFSSAAFLISLTCATTACVDVADGDAPEIATAEQALFHHEVRVRRIEAADLQEGGDEIFLTASQSQGGSINIIRPAADPDYWRFDDVGTCHTMDLHVGTIVSGLLIVNLMEQDGGSNQSLGTIDFALDHAGAPETSDTPTGHFVRIDNDGLWLVRFTGASARYYVWFQVGS